MTHHPRHGRAMIRTRLSEVSDLAALGRHWQALEQQADASFFQSWAWTGCLADRRYPHPVLLEAHDNDRPVALALFNRRPAWFAPETLWLGESGLPACDSVFTEHNAPLIVRDAPAGTLSACLAAALTQPIAPHRRAGFRRLILSGVPDSLLRSAPPAMIRRRQHSRPAPIVDLAAIPPAQSFLDTLSANTRQQIRRSDRRYERHGRLTLTAADGTAQALDWLDRLAALHQTTWQSRGHAGAFATPFFRQFHAALIARAPAHTQLLHIAAGDTTIGYLYNFLWRGRALAYQSGFDYAAADRHQKPGLTCHHLAIEHYRSTGLGQYDLLAGDDRYKRSFTPTAPVLHWLELLPRSSARAWAHSLRDRVWGGGLQQGQGSALDPPKAEPLETLT